MSRWGVGPGIAIASAVYFIVAGLATWLWPEVCLVTAVPHMVIPGGRDRAAGDRRPDARGCRQGRNLAYNSDKLATTRHLRPGQKPDLLGVDRVHHSGTGAAEPLMADVSDAARGVHGLQGTIGRENEYLEKRFGEEYRTYKAQVNELVPVSSAESDGRRT